MSNRAWLYYRLSRDDDIKGSSLENQRKILVEHANTHNLTIVGESFDDNVSGMHYNRMGIEQLDEAVENGLIDIVLVKDFSRLGRHKLLTELYIEKLRSYEIRVFSVSENLDSLDENNDLLIGIKQLLNEQYSKDLSRKINAGFEQKFKKGFVIRPPYGYLKDRNTGHIEVDDSAGKIVKIIFDMFMNGEKAEHIARFLTDCKIPTPSSTNSKAKNITWSSNTIRKILRNEAYVGTLICGKNRGLAELSSNFVHYDFYTPIIKQEIFDRVQEIINSKKSTPRNKYPKKKYIGLIICADCGQACVGIRRKNIDYYICRSYNKHGKSACTSHLISKQELETRLKNYLIQIELEVQEKITNIKNRFSLTDKQKYIQSKEKRLLLEKKASLENMIKIYKEYLPEMDDIKDEILCLIKSTSKELDELNDLLNSDPRYSNRLLITKKQLIDMSRHLQELNRADGVDITKMLEISTSILISQDSSEVKISLKFKKAY